MANQDIQQNNAFINGKSILIGKDLLVISLSIWLLFIIVFSTTALAESGIKNEGIVHWSQATDTTDNDVVTDDNEVVETDENETQTSKVIDIYDTLKVNESSYKLDTSWVAIARPDSAELASLNSDSDLQYGRSVNAVPSTSIWSVFTRWLLSKLGSWTYSESGDLFFNILYYGLIIGLCVALVYYISKSNISSIFKGASKQIEIGYEEISEDIHEVDIEQLINKYVAEKDFRRAVRYLYLQVLKSLTDARFIDWLPSKTNTTYSRELSANRNELTSDFIQLTRVFNYAWYGNYPLNENDFPTIQSSFSSFQNRIQSVKSKPSDFLTKTDELNISDSQSIPTIEGVQR